jgi:starch-binding outer membrane protein, SusD/RagB family
MRNIIKTTIVLFLILLASGCTKDYLDPVPKTNPIDENVFDTKERVVAQVNGMYSMMKNGAYRGGRFFVYNDIRCENFVPKSSNLVTNFATWNHTVLSGTNEVQNLWQAVYNAINAVNLFIDGLENAWTAGKLTGKITQAEKDQFRSEALALRAICYFDLLQLYAKPYSMNSGNNPGVPLRLKGIKIGGENDLARSTVAQVYTQILKDLNEAEPLSISTYSTSLLNTTRIHKNSIIAFKTRVYLHMQNWAAVITEANKIVSASAPFGSSTGVSLGLNASYAGIYAEPYTTKESIFSMPFTTTNTPGTQNGLAHYYNPASSESYYLITTAGSTYAKMDATDARKVMMVTSSGKIFLNKWPDYTNLTNYAPVMRYAEILLNLSEAIVRQGGAVDQRAVDLLNAVRTRSFTTGGYTLASFTTVQSFYDAMELERSMEFLGEGFRNIDLMRLGLTIPGKNGGSMGVVAAVPPTSLNYIWPISGNELTFNKLMTANE